MKKFYAGLAAGLLLLGTAGAATAAVGSYTITQLDDLELGFSKAYGINDSGQVVGMTSVGATLWNNGAATSLGQGDPYGINDSGQVVGASGVGKATLWSNGTKTILDSFERDPSLAFDINDSGQVAGFSAGFGNFGNSFRAIRWNNDGTMTDLGTLGGG